jgi:hypothetical protein
MSAEVSPIEEADGERNASFPAEWGAPRGSQFSEERAAWVRSKVASHTTVARYQTLARADARWLKMLREAALGPAARAVTPAKEENTAIVALLWYAEDHPGGEMRMDPAPELDDQDAVGLLIAYEHGVDATRVTAYRSLARSRGLDLEQVLRAALRGESADVVRLPEVRTNMTTPPDMSTKSWSSPGWTMSGRRTCRASSKRGPLPPLR